MSSPSQAIPSFTALYDLHVATVRQTARAIVGDPATAEDVAHEVFLDLWRRPAQFDPARGELGAFLRMKTRSRALDALRRSSSSTRLRDRCAHELALESPGVVEDPATAPTVRAAVRRLPEPQREAIALAYWGGLSCNEIAEHCGIPLGTAKSRMRLGLARLGRDFSLAPARPAAVAG